MKKRKLHCIKKSTNGITEFLDLNNPASCRRLFDVVVYNGRPITHFRIDGIRYAIKDLNDEEIKDAAAQFYKDFFEPTTDPDLLAYRMGNGIKKI